MKQWGFVNCILLMLGIDAVLSEQTEPKGNLKSLLDKNS